jgi:hypothetical protein
MSFACPRVPMADGADFTSPSPTSRIDEANLLANGLPKMPKCPRFAPNRVIDAFAYPAVQVLDVTGTVQVAPQLTVSSLGRRGPISTGSWRTAAKGLQPRLRRRSRRERPGGNPLAIHMVANQFGHRFPREGS